MPQSQRFEDLRKSLRPGTLGRHSLKISTETGYKNLIGTEFEGVGVVVEDAIFHVTSTAVTKIKQAKLGEEYECKLYSQECYILLKTTLKETKRTRMSLGGSPFTWTVYTWKGTGASLKAKGSTGTKASVLKNKLIANGSFHDCVILDLRQGEDDEKLLSLFKGCSIVEGKQPNVAVAAAATGEGVVSKTPKLYEVTLDRLRRVAVNPSAISAERSYIFDIGSEVYVYCGAECKSIVQKRYTEEMARRRCKTDYRGVIRPILVDEANEPKFFELLNRKNELLTTESDFKAPILYTFDTETDTLKRHEQDEEESSLFNAEVLVPHAIVVLDCFTEVFVWMGRGAPVAAQHKAFDLANEFHAEEGRPEFLEIERVRDRMEPVYFKERFFGFGEGGEDLEIHGHFSLSIPKAAVVKRGINQEIGRVFQFLKIELGQKQGDVRDDETASIQALQIMEDGDHILLEEDRIGIFESNHMYVYILSMKNNASHVIYTWEGQQASIRARTIAGILTSGGLDTPALGKELEGAKSYKYVQQGNEPRSLIRILAKLEKNLIIRVGKQGSGYLKKAEMLKQKLGFPISEHRRAFALEVSSHILDCSRITEVPFHTLKTNGLNVACSYIFIIEDKEKETSEVFYWNGSNSSADNCDLVGRVLDKQLEILARLPVASVAKIEADDLTDMDLTELGLREEVVEMHLPRERPMRLYNVSVEKRKVGGLFIIDTRKGIFSQSDLKKDGTYILDTGADKVYIWLGLNVSFEALHLAIDSGIAYVHKGLKEIMEGDMGEATFEFVSRGFETNSFKSCFNGWKNFGAATTKRPVNVDAAAKISLTMIGMTDAERKVVEDEREESRMKKGTRRRRNKRAQQTLNKKGTLARQRGKFVRYRRGTTLTLTAKMGGRIEMAEDKSFTVTGLGVGLKVLQDGVTVDTVCTEVRANADMDWGLYSYNAQKQLYYVGHGGGGVQALLDAIEHDQVYYGIIKVQAGNVPRVIFLIYRPPNVKPSVKNLVNVHKSVIREMLGPAFSEIIFEEKGELTTEKVEALAGRAQT